MSWSKRNRAVFRCQLCLLVVLGCFIGYHIPKQNRSKADFLKLTNLRVIQDMIQSRQQEAVLLFQRTFNASINPIWTVENIDLSRDTFTWWINLTQATTQTYEDVVNMVQELGVNSDLFLGERPSHCIKCAVVGNSGNLKESGYGNIIDTHDIIIRMNDCPTVGYEKDVGRRTTHYVAYPLSFNEDYMRNASFVLAAFNYKDMIWLKEKLADEKSNDNKGTFDVNKVFLYNPELMWHIKHKWGLGKGRWASSGLLCIFFALEICDEVNIFGFGATNKGNWDHYFENNNGEKNSQFRKTLVHDSGAEIDLIKQMVEAGKIAVYLGKR